MHFRLSYINRPAGCSHDQQNFIFCDRRLQLRFRICSRAPPTFSRSVALALSTAAPLTTAFLLSKWLTAAATYSAERHPEDIGDLAICIVCCEYSLTVQPKQRATARATSSGLFPYLLSLAINSVQVADPITSPARNTNTTGR